MKALDHSRPRWPFILCIVASFLATSLLACSENHAGITFLPGQTIPIPEVAALDRPGILKDAIGGHYAIVSVWATWCAPCRAEMPQLQELAKELVPYQIVALAVSIDDDDHRVREWLRQERITLPVFRDNLGAALKSTWGLNSVPQILLLSPDGRLIWSGATFNRESIMQHFQRAGAMVNKPSRLINLPANVKHLKQ